MYFEETVLAFIERRIYGADHFRYETALLRTLIRFIENHDAQAVVDPSLKKCLASLEAGEKSQATVEYKKLYVFGNQSLSDWSPPKTCSCETAESVDITFRALLHAWIDAMERLRKKTER